MCVGCLPRRENLLVEDRPSMTEGVMIGERKISEDLLYKFFHIFLKKKNKEQKEI